VRLAPKVFYLATLAAREQQRSLSSLIDYVIRKALTDGSFHQEPNQGLNLDITAPHAPPPMWFETLWASDPADRLYLLATARPDLMTDAERDFWNLSHGSMLINGQRVTVETYRKAYHHPDYYTAHLTESDEVQA
jgi:hypothetical protein